MASYICLVYLIAFSGLDAYHKPKKMREMPCLIDFHVLNYVLILVFLTLAYQDIVGTLATEEAEDAAQVAKLRSALESVDHKRRKVLFV